MMHYHHITTHCLNKANQEAVTASSESLKGVQQALADRSDKPAAPILNLCSETADIAQIYSLAKKIRTQCKHVIICGAGGSGLSAKVLANLALGFNTPALHILDNIDPDALDALLRNCPPEDTCVIAISKSGSTAETLSQFYVFLHHFKQALGASISDHFIVITVAQPSPLREAANEYKLQLIDHAETIGGRFSIFTSVGLLPAAIMGLDIAALRKGAANSVTALAQGEHPSRLGAALQYYHMQQGKSISVMLPYCERLSGFSSWYRQSWAESLGKNGKGTTPIRAVGTTDQHSQLQLYLDGPRDKFFNLILHQRAGHGQKIHAPNLAELDYLQGKTTGDIMAAEQKATLETLVQHGCPVRLMMLEKLNEEVLGALLMHFMLEIMFMAKLLHVNAFDQPAVEAGKILAREYLLSGRL